MPPGCWPSHPHLAHELPILAFTCWTALQAFTPGPVEAWQRDTFPAFCERMTARLGPGGCTDGRHVDCPAGPRLLAYHDRENADRRRTAIAADTHRDDGPAAGADTARPT